METLTGFIPAGGIGSRLNPHTLEKPKPLLIMGNNKRCLIDFSLNACINNCDHVLMTTCYQSEKIEKYVADIPKVRVLRDREVVGNAGSLLEHYEELSQEDSEGDFLIIPSDCVYNNFSLADFWKHHRASGSDVTLMVVPPKTYGEYVVVRGEKPQEIIFKPNYDCMSTTGIYVVKNKYILEWMYRKNKKNWKGEQLNLTKDIIHPAVYNDDVSIFRLPENGYWDDAGTIFRYHQNNMKISCNQNVIDVDAKVGEKSQLQRCVVLGKTEISGLNIQDAIISTRGSGCNRELVVTKLFN